VSLQWCLLPLRELHVAVENVVSDLGQALDRVVLGVLGQKAFSITGRAASQLSQGGSVSSQSHRHVYACFYRTFHQQSKIAAYL